MYHVFYKVVNQFASMVFEDLLPDDLQDYLNRGFRIYVVKVIFED